MRNLAVLYIIIYNFSTSKFEIFIHLLFFFTVFAWDAERKGTDVHLQADPTKLELLQTQFTTKKEDFKEKQKSSILDKVNF